MKSLLKLLLYSLLAFVLTIVTGCSASDAQKMYTGKERSPAEVARLVIPDDVVVLRVDSVKAQPPRGGRVRKTEIDILPGKRQLELKYVKGWAKDVYQRELVVSEPAKVEVVAEAGRTYEVAFEEPKTFDAAKEFAKAPVFKLNRLPGKRVAEPAEVKEPPQAELPKDKKPAEPEKEKEEVKSEAPNSLRQWWGKATEKERREFLQWAVDKL